MAASRLMIQVKRRSFQRFPDVVTVTFSADRQDAYAGAVSDLLLTGMFAVSAWCTEDDAFPSRIREIAVGSLEEQLSIMRTIRSETVHRIERGNDFSFLGRIWNATANGGPVFVDLEAEFGSLEGSWATWHKPLDYRPTETMAVALLEIARAHRDDRPFREAFSRVISASIAAAAEGRVGPSTAVRFLAQALAEDPFVEAAASASFPSHGPLREASPAISLLDPVTPGGGAASPARAVALTPRRTNGFAIASLIISLLIFLAPLGSIVGVICGHVALYQTKRDGTAGRQLAIAGLIIGYLILLLWLGKVGEAIHQSQVAYQGN